MGLEQKVLFEAWHGEYIDGIDMGKIKVVTRVVLPTIRDLCYSRGLNFWDVYDLENIVNTGEYRDIFMVKDAPIPCYTDGKLFINTVDIRTWWDNIQKGDFNSIALLFSKHININKDLNVAVFSKVLEFINDKEAIAKSFIGLVYAKFLEELAGEKHSMLDDDSTEDDTSEEYNNSSATDTLWKMYTLIGYMEQNLCDFKNALKFNNLSEIKELLIRCKFGDLSKESMLRLLYKGEQELEFSLRLDFECNAINLGLRDKLNNTVISILEDIYQG
ncbi:hypothetical protein D3C81_07960 [compost metagenome]